MILVVWFIFGGSLWRMLIMALILFALLGDWPNAELLAIFYEYLINLFLELRGSKNA